MITRHGISIIIYTFIAFALLLILYILYPAIWSSIPAGITGFIALFNLYFFRDPERTVPAGENLVLSPADGTVIRIDEVEETEYFKSRVTRLSIFLSVFSVHINRIPISGTVDFLRYKKGKFVAAFEHKASEENEQTIIGINSGNHRILFTQIAGIIARRIICNLNESDKVTAGNRFGMIRYGSRVDVYFPPEFKLKVSLRDKVTGGETVIGEII